MSEIFTTPSTPASSPRKTRDLRIFFTLARTISPRLCFSRYFSSGRVSSCFRPSLILRSSLLISITCTHSLSPTATYSSTEVGRPSQVRSEMCSSPSTPSSSSMKAPKLTILTTLATSRLPRGYVVSMPSQGSVKRCLMPREIFPLSLSISRTFTSISSPLRSFSRGWLMRP